MIFWFPLLTGSLSCTLFSLVSFGFIVCVCVCVCVCSFVFVSICLIFLLWFVWFHFLFLLFVLIHFISMTNSCGILIPQSDAGSESLGWEWRVQDSRPPANSWVPGVLIRENAHEGLCLNPRPGITQLPAAPAAPNNQQDRKTNPIRQVAPRHPKTHNLTSSCPSEGKNLSPPTRMKAQVPPNPKPT